MRKKNIAGKRGNRPFTLVSENTSFAYQEAFKSLRTNLQFLSMEKQIKKILITSAIPGENKTSTAINLAVTLADAGNSVLLIDCDLRKPAVHKYLHIDKSSNKGLARALSSRQLKDAIIPCKDIGIHVIISDMIPPNPAELLGSAKMGALLSALESHYNYIILDTPPVSVVTDAAVLSQFADGVILAVRQNFATVDQIQRAKKNLEAVNANILGAVLTDFNMNTASKSGGYGYGYGYGYGSYGSDYAYSHSGSDEDDE